MTKKELQASIAIFVENNIGSLNHIIGTFHNASTKDDEHDDDDSDSDNGTLINNITQHQQANVTNKPAIIEIYEKAKEGLRL